MNVARRSAFGVPSTAIPRLSRSPRVVHGGQSVTTLGGLGAKEPSTTFRDYPFPDGYTYRQYANGAITIVKSPRSKVPVVVTKESNPTAWQAITAQIRAYKQGRVLETTQAVLNLVAATTSTVATATKKKKPAQKKVPDDDVETSVEEAPAIPWGMIGVGTLLLLGVAAVARGQRAA